jgi:hypothetical protein
MLQSSGSWDVDCSQSVKYNNLQIVGVLLQCTPHLSEDCSISLTVNSAHPNYLKFVVFDWLLHGHTPTIWILQYLTDCEQCTPQLSEDCCIWLTVNSPHPNYLKIVVFDWLLQGTSQLSEDCSIWLTVTVHTPNYLKIQSSDSWSVHCSQSIKCYNL